MRNIVLGALLIALLLSGCGARADSPAGQPVMGNGMSSRHHAVVPEEYAGLSSPAQSESDIEKGGELYAKLCAACHGDGGMGDGPSAASLDPAPAPVAHTSSMLGDAYLYWRTADGGAAFKSTMPAWKSSLSESEIWAVIGYMRALGSGQVMPERAMGGESYDPAAEKAFHEEMLAQAVDQGLITELESQTFLVVHAAMDEYRTAHAEELPQGDMDETQAAILDELVKVGTITQPQADDFARIHQLLLDEGLMD